jgi:CheY-like chemotaxis protein
VSARSDGVGQGAEFIVRLPLAGARAAVEQPARRAVATHRLILVIDDDADARDGLKMLLEQEGHAVVLAEDGPRGIEAARAAEYDAIIIDIGLPGLEGHEVSRHLRARSGPHPFLIALTGYSQPDDRRRAEEAGFNAYLVSRWRWTSSFASSETCPAADIYRRGRVRWLVPAVESLPGEGVTSRPATRRECTVLAYSSWIAAGVTSGRRAFHRSRIAP